MNNHKTVKTHNNNNFDNNDYDNEYRIKNQYE